MKLATVGYWRVSTDRQGREGVSLDNQAAAGARWCVENGAELVASFVEDESAWTKRGGKRPALAEAFGFIRAESGRVRYFLVYDLSRFARSVRDQTRLVDELEALGVALRTVAMPLDDRAHGKLVANLLGGINQFQSDLASEKISATMADVARHGRLPHRAPIGYRNGRDETGRKVIEPDPERAALVARAFELAAGGAGVQAIAAELARLGLRSQAGRVLRAQDVHRVLRNRFYRGDVVSRRHGFEVPGEHEALVGRELWERAQRRRGGAVAARREARPAVVERWPLRGWVRCSGCGKPVTAALSRGRHGGQWGYYFCWSPGCRSASARADLLEGALERELAGLGLAPVALAAVEAQLAALWRERRADEEAKRAAAERELAALRRRRDRLVEAFVFEQAIDRGTYDRQIERLDRAIAEGNFEPRRIDAGAEGLAALLARARPLLADPSVLWRRAAVAEKRRIQALVYPAGAVLDGAELRTPDPAFLFNAFRVAQARKSGMVEQKRATSNPGGVLVDLAEWLREAGEVVRLAA